MKLFRYGPRSHEKRALIDKGGHWRDLSSCVPDIGAATLPPESLAKLRPEELAASRFRSRSLGLTGERIPWRPVKSSVEGSQNRG